MAITAFVLTSNKDITDASSRITASITPTASRLQLAAIASRVSTGTPNAPTLSGNGLTWVQVTTIVSTVPPVRLTLFRAMSASPSSGAVTIDYGGQTQIVHCWSFTEFAGIDTGGTNGSAAVLQPTTAGPTTDTSITVTLGAFSSVDNATYGCFEANGQQATTPGVGFSELTDNWFGADNLQLETEWRADNDTTVDASDGSYTRMAIAVEIAVPSSGLVPHRMMMGVGV